MILIADSGATKTDWRLITGSTRMKSGTSQKLILNMISDELGLEMEESKRLLLLHGSVRNVLDSFNS
ncbi:MAG: hypothetical protein K8R52_07035 [Bacteroidales bacterium]|nr:hypothetical protein [Bacteroidales bacterium]